MRRAAATLLIALAVSSCTESGGSAADPTVPTSAPTSSATSAPDVSVIPETIDEPYLNAVLAALDEVDGQATRIIKESKRLTPEAADLLNAIYSDDQTDRQADVWLESLATDPQLRRIVPDPGSRRTIIERLITASSSCVWAAVRRDYSKVAVDATPGPVEYLALRPLDRTNDPQGRNRTAWMITADGYRDDGAEPANPCRSG